MRALSRCGHFHFIRIARIPRARADRAAAADPARALPLEQRSRTMPTTCPRSLLCYQPIHSLIIDATLSTHIIDARNYRWTDPTAYNVIYR